MLYLLERVAKDSLLSQNSTTSAILPPPVASRSPPSRPPIQTSRNGKNSTKISATPARNGNQDNETSSCSSPSSSDDEGQLSDVENEEPQTQSTSSANKRTRADATSTESLSPPRDTVTNTNRMILRSSARKQQQEPSSQNIPASTPSFRQQRKHRRIDLDITPLSTTNKKKLPPTQSSTPHTNK